jgi:hypothetical protein
MERASERVNGWRWEENKKKREGEKERGRVNGRI